MVLPPHLRGKTIPPHLRHKYNLEAPTGDGNPTAAKSPTAESSLAATPTTEQPAPTTPSAAPITSRTPSGLAASIHAPPATGNHAASPSEQQTIKAKLASVGATVTDSEPASRRALLANTSSEEPGGGALLEKTSTSVQKGNVATGTSAHQVFKTAFTNATANSVAAGFEAGKRSRTGSSARRVQPGPHHQYTVPSQRGRGRGGRDGRGSKWPKNSEIPKGDPDRWAIKWQAEDETSPIDSARSDSGAGAIKKKADVPPGIDPATGFLLTDFSGNWAPAPIDWDSRPAFRPEQSVATIEKWLGRTEEEMVGKVWAVSQNDFVGVGGKTYYFAPDPDDKELLIQGEIAPHYWSPLIIGRESPTTFWTKLMRSTSPEPQDVDDLVGVKPWWEQYESGDSCTLRPLEHPSVVGMQPGETGQLRLRRENDQGSLYHTENRQRLEIAKVQAERERRRKAMEKARKLSAGPPRTIKTGMALCLRPAGPEDISRITEIYNFYVEHSVCVPETTRRQDADILLRFRDITGKKLPFVVACERGGQVKLRKKRHEPIILPDKIVGFAYAADHHDPTGMYRFTANLSAYVDSAHYMKGIAACLFDKLLGLLDCNHVERGGYGAEDLEGDGVSRVVANFVVTVPYENDERLEWKGRFLTLQLGFEQVGKMMRVGNKLGQSVNLATFQRKTGVEIDPANPPISADYLK